MECFSCSRTQKKLGVATTWKCDLIYVARFLKIKMNARAVRVEVCALRVTGGFVMMR